MDANENTPPIVAPWGTPTQQNSRLPLGILSNQRDANGSNNHHSLVRFRSPRKKGADADPKRRRVASPSFRPTEQRKQRATIVTPTEATLPTQPCVLVDVESRSDNQTDPKRRRVASPSFRPTTQRKQRATTVTPTEATLPTQPCVLVGVESRSVNQINTGTQCSDCRLAAEPTGPQLLNVTDRSDSPRSDREALHGTVQEYIKQVIFQQFRMHPKPYQLECFEHVLRQSMHQKPCSLLVVRRTADGKSLVTAGLSLMIPGVAITVVPTITLAADQAAHAKKRGFPTLNVHACKKATAQMLSAIEERFASNKNASVMLFCTPKVIAEEDGSVSSFLKTLFDKGLVSMLVIDEIHKPVEEDFRAEDWQSLRPFIKAIQTTYRSVPILGMTATFSTEYADVLQKTLGLSFNKCVWGKPSEFARRQVTITLTMRCTTYLPQLKSSLAAVFDDERNKCICFTLTAEKAKKLEGQLVELSTDQSKESDSTSHVMCIFGDVAWPIKVAKTLLFTQDCSEDGDGVPNINCQFLVATTGCANVGISHPYVMQVKRIGMPTSRFECIQEMGRLYRDETLALPYRYDMFFCLSDIEYTFQRICKVTDRRASRMKMQEFSNTIALLTETKKCWHYCFEKLQGRQTVPYKDTGCNGTCPVCSGHLRKDLLINFSRCKLKECLITNLLRPDKSTKLTELSDILVGTKEERMQRYGRKTVDKYRIEYLILQLISSNILRLYSSLSDSPETCIGLAHRNAVYHIHNASLWEKVA